MTYQFALILYGLSEIIFPYKQNISVDMKLMSCIDKVWHIKKILNWKNIGQDISEKDLYCR